MSTLIAVIPLALALFIASLACNTSVATSGEVAPVGLPAQNQPSTPASNFIAVEGADLSARMDAAQKRARSASTSTPFWTAYAFDVRPGIAVDPQAHEFHGSINYLGSGGTNVFIGTSNGRTVETRNLGIFLLREPTGGAVTRVEVYNLERQREYSRYPVYWTGRAGNEESLNYLRGLAEPAGATTRSSLVSEHAALAIALHDDGRVSDLLKTFVRNPSNPKVRATAVYWLGQVGGQQGFLSEIVRNENETVELRRSAAHAIGESRDQTALSTMQSLYEAVGNREVHYSIINAVADNENKDGAISFLLKIAKGDADREARRRAIHQLGEMERESIVDELMNIYAAAQTDPTIQTAVLHALSEMQSQRAEAKLLEIARTGASAEVRAQAIHRLGERASETTVDELMKIYNADTSTQVRAQILHAFSEMQSDRAEDRLFEIARRNDSRELRSQAIHWIGERAGRRSLDMLSETVNNANGDTEVQLQAVHAIGERPAEEAVPLLIKIARTHASPHVRQYAIKQLGESGDPRAVEFFKELLGK